MKESHRKNSSKIHNEIKLPENIWQIRSLYYKVHNTQNANFNNVSLSYRVNYIN